MGGGLEIIAASHLITSSLLYSSHTVNFTHLSCPTEWLVHSQKLFDHYRFGTFHHPKKKPCSHEKLLPAPQVEFLIHAHRASTIGILNKSHDTGVCATFKSTKVSVNANTQNRLPINRPQLTLLRIIQECKKSIQDPQGRSPAHASHTLTLHPGQEGTGCTRKGARPRGSSRHTTLAVLKGPQSAQPPPPVCPVRRLSAACRTRPRPAGHSASSAAPEYTCFADERAGWFT